MVSCLFICLAGYGLFHWLKPVPAFFLLLLLSIFLTFFIFWFGMKRDLKPLGEVLDYLQGIISGTKLDEAMPKKLDRVLTGVLGSTVKKEDFLRHIRDFNQEVNMSRQFTANVSHELKGPLTSIIGYAELLKTGQVPKEDQVKFIDIIHREGDRLLLMINQIIELSKFDSGFKDYDKREVFDFTAMVKETVESLRPFASNYQVSIYFQGPQVFTYGNKNLLKDMVENLINNAVKYSKPKGGSVLVTVSLQKSQLADQVLPLVFRVKDNGIGISQEDQELIFKRFYRVDKARTRTDYSGTGLGLALVKHTVQVHGGRIVLHSAPGWGSEFIIYLPASPDPNMEEENTDDLL